MGGAELQMSRFRADVIRYKVYKNHNVLFDVVHFPKCGKMQISPNLDFSCTNQDQIRNQRPRLRGNSLYSYRKARGFFRCSIQCYCGTVPPTHSNMFIPSNLRSGGQETYISVKQDDGEYFVYGKCSYADISKSSIQIEPLPFFSQRRHKSDAIIRVIEHKSQLFIVSNTPSSIKTIVLPTRILTQASFTIKTRVQLQIPFVTWSRGERLVLTAIAILVVDFPHFPSLPGSVVRQALVSWIVEQDLQDFSHHGPAPQHDSNKHKICLISV